MAVTQSPAEEALQSVVDRINASVILPLSTEAQLRSEIIDPLESIKSLRIDVVHDTEVQLEETLDSEDRTSHIVQVWIRKRCLQSSAFAMEALRLVARQVYQQLNNFLSPDSRVRIREVSFSDNENPSKQMLREAGLFVSVITCRVEVKTS